ncbi:hypothetical protein [Cerasicoccus frondis]|uniref:hypothetical protein n=1 Tax=Cerasicoccus frondis TaxID=490090 RepID=UPI002852BAE8|nr:hypothetical protein [Cerasicoccus frondis]
MKYVFGIFLASLLLSAAHGVMLKGANGRKVDFAGVLKASEAGLTVKIGPSDDAIVVPWEKFDLEDMKTEQPKIYSAYTRSSLGHNEVMLRLGVYEDFKTYDELIVSLRKLLDEPFYVPIPSSYDHWFNNYYSKRNRSIEDWQRAHARYRQMINDLFGGALIVHNSRGGEVSGTYYYYFSYYSSSSWHYTAKITSKRVLNYFASDKDSFHDTLAYIQDNPMLVIGVAEKLQSAKSEFAQNGHALVQTEHGTIDFVLDSSISTLEKMAEGRAYNERSSRVLAKLLHAAYKESPKGV